VQAGVAAAAGAEEEAADAGDALAAGRAALNIPASADGSNEAPAAPANLTLILRSGVSLAYSATPFSFRKSSSAFSRVKSAGWFSC